jgi:hypothetical protein
MSNNPHNPITRITLITLITLIPITLIILITLIRRRMRKMGRVGFEERLSRKVKSHTTDLSGTITSRLAKLSSSAAKNAADKQVP